MDRAEGNRIEAQRRLKATKEQYTHTPKENQVTEAESSNKRQKREYNLSTMEDTRGGFIMDKQSDVAVIPKQSIHEYILPSDAECQGCHSPDLDKQLHLHFSLSICRKCRDLAPDLYSLLTKTECKEDYLLTESELKNNPLLKFWEKPNPNKQGWNNMCLYLRRDVEVFAFTKWGSEQGLDAEFDRRNTEKSVVKEKKFVAKMAELRKKTRTTMGVKKREVHEHTYEPKVFDKKKDCFTQVCLECGLMIEFDEF